jgi:hypothetical protein
VVHGARTGPVRLEELSDEDLQALALDFEKLRARFAIRERRIIHRGSHESQDSDDEMKARLQRIEERLARIEANQTSDPPTSLNRSATSVTARA